MNQQNRKLFRKLDRKLSIGNQVGNFRKLSLQLIDIMKVNSFLHRKPSS